MKKWLNRIGEQIDDEALWYTTIVVVGSFIVYLIYKYGGR